MTETPQEPSHHTLREELQEMVVKDLLGPAGGPEEEVDEARVSDRYLVGTLNSKRRHKCLGYYHSARRAYGSDSASRTSLTWYSTSVVPLGEGCHATS